jgi:hypothetical protein
VDSFALIGFAISKVIRAPVIRPKTVAIINFLFISFLFSVAQTIFLKLV